ncbi:unnamed protein product [Closterium sp. NIES-53]
MVYPLNGSVLAYFPCLRIPNYRLLSRSLCFPVPCCGALAVSLFFRLLQSALLGSHTDTPGYLATDSRLLPEVLHSIHSFVLHSSYKIVPGSVGVAG